MTTVQTAVSGALSQRAMLASVNISRWQATRTDKRISNEVASEHAVSAKRAGSYRKHAIDTSAPSFQAVVQADGELRAIHYTYTLPWSNDGPRILTAAAFPVYSEKLRHARAARQIAVDAFIADYPRLCANARNELNGMYDPTDYPTDIAAKFGVSVSILPLPDAGDFRVNLGDADVSAIRSSIAEEIENATAVAMREPYERLHQHLTRMVERLSDPDNKFKDSIVHGLRDICEVLPALNLTGDARLTALGQQAERLIAGVEAQQLRDDLTKREAVARGAQDIISSMAGFMGAAQ